MFLLETMVISLPTHALFIDRSSALSLIESKLLIRSFFHPFQSVIILKHCGPTGDESAFHHFFNVFVRTKRLRGFSKASEAILKAFCVTLILICKIMHHQLHFVLVPLFLSGSVPLPKHSEARRIQSKETSLSFHGEDFTEKKVATCTLKLLGL